jgi:hypothetical protein
MEYVTVLRDSEQSACGLTALGKRKHVVTVGFAVDRTVEECKHTVGCKIGGFRRGLVEALALLRCYTASDGFFGLLDP